MSAQIFTLPDVGEGLTEAEIVAWKVSEGDAITLNQVVLEIETAKSLVELPSPFEGTLTRILVQPGETVPVGTPIYEVSGADSGSGEGTTTPEPELKPLVGTGPVAEDGSRRRRRGAGAAPEPAAAESTATTEPAPEPEPVASAPVSRPLAKPPVRKAAKDAGVDLADLPATGQHGEVTRKDLEGYLAGRGAAVEETEEVDLPVGPTSVLSLSDTADRGFLGDTQRIPVRGVRKMTATAMVDSAFSAPHVSVFKQIDATATMDLVQSLRKRRDFQDIKVTPLLVVAKACIYALERTRSVNASWTDEEILVKNFVNLGIAAATPRGLIVPNIKDAHTMGLRELAVAINELTQTARAGKTKHADTLQGTFTITNIGSLGVDTGTPIINPGEVGILAFGSIRQKPWVVDGELAVRWVTTVGGSFDHRVVDGDLAARFIADVASVLEDPMLLLG